MQEHDEHVFESEIYAYLLLGGESGVAAAPSSPDVIPERAD
ncbi:hypothetical protein [Nocardia sp. NPDC057272]